VKVLHVVHGFLPESDGGVERYLEQILPAQRARAHDVGVLTGSLVPWEQCGLERTSADGTPVIRLHRDDLFFDHHVKAWHPAVERLVADVFARERPQLVHVHQWIRLTANLVEIAEATGCATVVTLHDAYPTCPRVFRVDRDGRACNRPLSVASCLSCVPRYGHESDAELAEGIELFAAHTRSEVLRARAAVVASEATAALLAGHLDVPRERITVVPLPPASRLPQRLPPVVVPPPPAPLRFGYFGALAPHKGVRVLVDAFARLCAEPPGRPVELVLFGRDDEPGFAAELRAAAQGLPVAFAGRYDGATLAAAGLHCAVLPSLAFEGYGRVLDEAFELGLPVVVSDVGAPAARAGAAGVRVPPGDPEALARALRALATEPDRLARMARAIPPPPPPLAAHVDALDAVYARALATPPRTDAPAVDPLRRAAFVVRQRESALGRITPPGGPR